MVARVKRAWREHRVAFVSGGLGTLYPVLKVILWLVERGGDVDFLISLHERFREPIGAFLALHWDLAIPLVGLLLLWFSLRQPKEAASTQLGTLKPVAAGLAMPETAPGPEPTKAELLPAALASPESCERLLTLYKHWEEALGHAAAFLRQISLYEAGATRATELLAKALREEVLVQITGTLGQIAHLFNAFTPQRATQKEFQDLGAALLQVALYCHNHLILWINLAGPVISGERIFSSDAYARLYEDYKAAVAVSKSYEFHSEVKHLAKKLETMEPKLRKPEDPPPSTAS